MGPGAGRAGGEIVFEGTLAGLQKAKTMTGLHLSKHQEVNRKPRKATGHLSIEKASLNNLRNVSVKIPTGVLTVVTGVAGSGKSSLIQGCLPEKYPDAVFVDQTLTAGSRRSNLASYSGMLDPIRKAFATANKVSPAFFSANSKGACPACQGLGVIYTDLQHLDPVATTCEACGGKCFTEEVLGYLLRGKNINDVMKLSVVEGAEFFTEKPVLSMLRALRDVGLGYISLGQTLNTLSGGERQRLKLANELGEPSKLLVLDEPTTGLHLNDVDNLVKLLHRMVDNGTTVIVIEHNLDVMACADWIIDMVPGAGTDGGRIVFEGTPAELVKDKKSLTGQHLAKRMKEVPAGSQP
jgi:excinuclease UvrABC ATPase subunit